MRMPFTMVGRLGACVLLSYRTPAASVAGLLPPGLELVTRGPWAFWNVVACRVEAMRPKGVPAFCGIAYHHVAYRLLVQAMNDRAQVRRGLYFVRSDVDSAAVAVLGERMTDLRLHRATITHDAAAGVWRVCDTERGLGDMSLRVTPEPPRLRPGSCFPTLHDAVESLRYPPLGLAVDEGDDGCWLRLTHVKRDDRAWREAPATVAEADLPLLKALGQHEATLELATVVEPIDYAWTLGGRDRLMPGRLQDAGAPRRPAEPMPEPAAMPR